MVLCVPEETGWERLPTGAGSLVLSVRPATAAPAGETSVRQTQRRLNRGGTKTKKYKSHNPLEGLAI